MLSGNSIKRVLLILLFTVLSFLVVNTTFSADLIWWNVEVISDSLILWEEHNLEVNWFKWIVSALVMFFLILIIATERIHRTMAAFLFGSLLIFISHTLGYFDPNYQFLTLEQAFAAIDWDVIALLAWMMIIVWVLLETWVFQWIAYKLFELSKWSRVALLVLFMIATWVLSAILDNVTTMFLVAPVAISIAKIVNVNPIAYLMPMILASNVGWASTLVWDPPNIIIWSYAGLSFNDFLINMWLPVILIMIFLVFQMKFIYSKDLKSWAEVNFQDKVEELKSDCKIKHIRLLRVSASVLWFVVLFFLLHWFFHMPAAVPALAWAGILLFLRDYLIISKHKGKYESTVEEERSWIIKAFEKDVEWSVLAFFAFLFMIVWSLEHSWLLTELALLIQNFFWDNLLMCAIAILWISAIASAFLDNIPFTVVMLPIVALLVAWFDASWANWEILWWALALWACLWWNWTLIWASANIVTIWIMEKHWIKFSFMDFFKVWFPSMLIQVFIAMICVIFMVKFMW